MQKLFENKKRKNKRVQTYRVNERTKAYKTRNY